VVVGAPHDEKGETPVAFVIPAPAEDPDDDLARLKNLVRSEKGVTAVPSDFLVVSAFPETRSGKYMRRTLRAILLDEPLGDLSTLRNPEVVEEIRRRRRVAPSGGWPKPGRSSRATATCASRTTIGAGQKRSRWSSSTHPPVNSLNERSLDELNTVLQHIAHREETPPW
jgi:acrylyl-CoA reductase (NADPH)/3-hydroxypropionyl-CoA dehydratase/3-hydroxypropionyl-CoA synthetase